MFVAEYVQQQLKPVCESLLLESMLAAFQAVLDHSLCGHSFHKITSMCSYIGLILLSPATDFPWSLITQNSLKVSKVETQSSSYFCFRFTFSKQGGLLVTSPELRKHPLLIFSCHHSLTLTPTGFLVLRVSASFCGSLWQWGMALWDQSAPGGVIVQLLPYLLS